MLRAYSSEEDAIIGLGDRFCMQLGRLFTEGKQNSWQIQRIMRKVAISTMTAS